MSLVHTHELRERGVGASAVRRMVRDGELHKIRRGAFSTAAPNSALALHRTLLTSTLPLLGPENVVSHVSAAVLHGLPVASRELARVTSTRPGKGGGRITPYLHQYRTPLPAQDVLTVDGVRCTNVARTIVDLGRCGDLASAVAAADAALRLGAPVEQLQEQLVAARRRRGLAQARAVVKFADGLSESWGESVSRVAIWWLGLPPPDLQFEVHVDGTTYRSDFAWPQFDVLGEFDGKVKYGELLSAGMTAADAVMREKQRDSALASLGWKVVHWVYADVAQPARLGRLLRPALVPRGAEPARRSSTLRG